MSSSLSADWGLTYSDATAKDEKRSFGGISPRFLLGSAERPMLPPALTANSAVVGSQPNESCISRCVKGRSRLGKQFLSGLRKNLK